MSGKITTWMDSLFGGGPGKSGVAVDRDTIEVRMGGDRFEIPRGSADGLVEVIVDPPFHTARTLSTMFVRERVNSLLVSLLDPDGFIAAIEGHR